MIQRILKNINLNKKNSRVILYSIITLQSVFLLYWIFNDPTNSFMIYKPGMDKLGAGGDTADTKKIKIGEHFQRFSNYQSDLTGKWIKFRGINHDNILNVPYAVNFNWKQKDPKLMWQIDMGEGHAAPVIYNGLVYILDYDEDIRADMLRCFALETGEEIWRRWYNIHLKRNHGMSRTIPAITDSVIVTIGPECHVMCVERESGDFKWGIDLVADYGAETPFWYTGQCPLIVNDTAIIAIGGTALLIGVDVHTGKVLWQTPNNRAWHMSHSSVVPMTIHGKRMYVYAAIGGICGISAEPEDAGQLLWETIDWAPNVIAPSPVQLPAKNEILLTAGYGAGGAVLQINRDGNKFDAIIKQKYEPRNGLSSEQQTPILYDSKLFTIMPKDAGGNRNQFICFNANDCTKIKWSSGKTHRYGLGPYMVLNDKVIILNDEGTLNVIDAKSNKFNLISQKKVLEGHDAWGPLAFADGYLLLRDSKKLYCLNLKP